MRATIQRKTNEENKQKVTKTAFTKAVSVFVFFVTGLIIGLIPSVYIIWQLTHPKYDQSIPKSSTQADIQSLIHIKNVDDLERKRQELIQIIWGNNYHPNKQPFHVTENIQDERISQLKGINKVDRLEIEMDHGINSVAYLFNPHQGRPLAIYHQGHDGDFFTGKATIQAFIDKGYMVLCFSMPLIGDNNQPTVNISGTGPVEFSGHERLKFLDNPLQFFMEPILEGLNYVQSRYLPDQVIMIGYSGGGWSTTVYAAIDPRIHMSFPVAGSLPIFLRNHKDWGDFEQTFPPLYQNVNYLDLYIMGSSGNNRRQLQVLNELDPCCFAGTKNLFYENEIAKIASSLGGKFSVYLDNSHKSHCISPAALERIFYEIDSFAPWSID